MSGSELSALSPANGRVGRAKRVPTFSDLDRIRYKLSAFLTAFLLLAGGTN